MNELKNKTVKELRELAKEHNITGRWDMTKAQLIEALSVVSTPEENDFKNEDIPFETDCVIKKTTSDYLAEIKVGTLVAFKRNKDKNLAMSGKFQEFKNGKVYVLSKRGTVFEINPENIIWVKTGTRWPKWVYALFNSESEEKSSNEDIHKDE